MREYAVATQLEGGKSTFELAHFHPANESIFRFLQIKLTIIVRVLFILLGMAGFGDFLSIFMGKLIFLMATRKYDKILKLKYLIQVLGINMMLYYYAKEIRVSLNPLNDKTHIKVGILVIQSIVNIMAETLFATGATGQKHRMQLKGKHMIITGVFLQYTLTYASCNMLFAFVLYNLALFYLLYRYLLMKNSVPFLEQLYAVVNTQSNFDLLVNLNMEDQMRQIS